MKKVKRKKRPKIKHDSTLKKEIGSRFKMFRHTMGKSQKQLANELQIYQSSITNIEKGKTSPGIAYLYYFYNKYRLNADWLINGNGEIEVIFGKLVEMKKIAKDEIEEYKRTVGKQEEKKRRNEETKKRRSTLSALRLFPTNI